MQLDISACSLCGKIKEDILIITSVDMDIHSRYLREDGALENMNGLRKQTREYFCEECFNAFVDKMSSFVSERQAAKKQEAS
jgi:hypothetical protein